MRYVKGAVRCFCGVAGEFADLFTGSGKFRRLLLLSLVGGKSRYEFSTEKGEGDAG